jgi:hypothetical protein
MCLARKFAENLPYVFGKEIRRKSSLCVWQGNPPKIFPMCLARKSAENLPCVFGKEIRRKSFWIERTAFLVLPDAALSVACVSPSKDENSANNKATHASMGDLFSSPKV